MKANKKNHESHIVGFWESVDTSGECWLWRRAIFKRSGYGAYRWYGKTRSAHTLAYELCNGPRGDLHVMHSCDVRACVNPAHLSLGTIADNNRDMRAKGRYASGIDAPAQSFAKVTPREVLEIRKLQGLEDSRDVAKRFGLSRPAVYSIWNRHSWGWL